MHKYQAITVIVDSTSSYTSVYQHRITVLGKKENNLRKQFAKAKRIFICAKSGDRKGGGVCVSACVCVYICICVA